ncbi:MAG: chromate resistance protein, partial [Desulfobulbaceae bacterium]|nr:chromate resistance protein [Desulfobulbaceae bacterium]
MRSDFTLYALVLLFLLPLISKAPASEGVFSTWDVFETDKCASIWLIKRFIDPQAEIRFFPHGTSITKGIPFDTPEAKFRRYATKSTYETLMEHYNFKDPRLKYIGRIIHDIEVNIWEKKVYTESTK